MTNADSYPSIDPAAALQKLRRLQLENGDLGAEYRHQISLLLKDAAQHRQRALSAEQKLEKIQAWLKNHSREFSSEGALNRNDYRSNEELRRCHLTQLSKYEHSIEINGRQKMRVFATNIVVLAALKI